MKVFEKCVCSFIKEARYNEKEIKEKEEDEEDEEEEKEKEEEEEEEEAEEGSGPLLKQEVARWYTNRIHLFLFCVTLALYVIDLSSNREFKTK
uniref:Uncharacterized protein n=1 Tax=Vespula pensylvanica TaxID=30213 RepID=A0A834NYJ7_VESPE|nr:hypothetical protein H0235_009346 [Vespula pensylvanica]